MFENFFGGLIKLIITLSAGALGVIPGLDGNDVAFSSFEFSVADNQILISAQIQDQLNPRIDDIITSGRTVRLKITSRYVDTYGCTIENNYMSLREHKRTKNQYGRYIRYFKTLYALVQ